MLFIQCVNSTMSDKRHVAEWKPNLNFKYCLLLVSKRMYADEYFKLTQPCFLQLYICHPRVLSLVSLYSGRNPLRNYSRPSPLSHSTLHTHSARLTFIITSGSALIGQLQGMAASDWRILSRDNTQRAHNTTHQRERRESKSMKEQHGGWRAEGLCWLLTYVLRKEGEYRAR